MKVLVTGGAGFIGSHTVDLLLSKGYDVSILDNLEPPVHPERKKPLFLPSAAEFFEGDVSNPDVLTKALKGVDVVLHLAAYQGLLNDFGKFARVNDMGTALIYETIYRQKLPVKRVVIASSQAVYGDGKYKCPQHGTVFPLPRTLTQLEEKQWEPVCPQCFGKIISVATDEKTVGPHNQYAVSKYCQELWAFNMGRRIDVPTVALRYSITQGHRQSFFNAYSGILRIFTIRFANHQPLVIYEDGRQLRDYVAVEDVAKANVLAIEDPRTDYEVYNVGGNEVFSVLEYAKLFSKIIGKNILLEISGKFRYGDTRHMVSDISKIKSLGWHPAKPIAAVIKDYLKWSSDELKSDYYADAERTMKAQGVIRGG
jgi:dTDP-L-rhamnose 4-epimerase